MNPKMTIELEFDMNRFGGTDLMEYMRCRKDRTFQWKMEKVMLEFLNADSRELFKAMQKVAKRDERYSDFLAINGTVNGRKIPDYHDRDLAFRREEKLRWNREQRKLQTKETP